MQLKIGESWKGIKRATQERNVDRSNNLIFHNIPECDIRVQGSSRARHEEACWDDARPVRQRRKRPSRPDIPTAEEARSRSSAECAVAHGPPRRPDSGVTFAPHITRICEIRFSRQSWLVWDVMRDCSSGRWCRRSPYKLRSEAALRSTPWWQGRSDGSPSGCFRVAFLASRMQTSMASNAASCLTVVSPDSARVRRCAARGCSARRASGSRCWRHEPAPRGGVPGSPGLWPRCSSNSVWPGELAGPPTRWLVEEILHRSRSRCYYL